MRIFLLALVAMAFIKAPMAVADENPVVIELFTSQGCSSCPPADAFMHDLAKREDVIALALHVDYWDYIGWKDIFASPAYTQRQHAYARAANAATVYTPQMVIGGTAHVIGSRPMQVMDQVQAQRAKGAQVTVSMVRNGDRLRITAPPTKTGSYVVQMVRYKPEETVSIRRGENAGRNLSYSNIVTSWREIAQWDGAGALNLDAPVSGAEPVVVIVQRSGHGAILGAARLR